MQQNANHQADSGTDYELSSLSTVLSHEFSDRTGICNTIQEGMLLRKLEKQNKAKFKSKKFRFNILLIGSPGVGKSSIRQGMMSKWHLVRERNLEGLLGSAKEYLYQINEHSSFFQTCIIECRPSWDVVKYNERKIEEYMEKLTYSPLRRAMSQRLSLFGGSNGASSSGDNQDNSSSPSYDADGILLDERIHLCMWVFGSQEVLWRGETKRDAPYDVSLHYGDVANVPEMEIPAFSKEPSDPSAASFEKDAPVDRKLSYELVLNNEDDKMTASVIVKKEIEGKMKDSTVSSVLSINPLHDVLAQGLEMSDSIKENGPPPPLRQDTADQGACGDPEKTPVNKNEKTPTHLRESEDKEMGVQLIGQSVSEEIREDMMGPKHESSPRDIGRGGMGKTKMVHSLPGLIQAGVKDMERGREDFFGEHQQRLWMSEVIDNSPKKNPKDICEEVFRENSVVEKKRSSHEVKLTEEEQSSLDRVRQLISGVNGVLPLDSLESEKESGANTSQDMSPVQSEKIGVDNKSPVTEDSSCVVVENDLKEDDLNQSKEKHHYQTGIKEPCATVGDIWKVMKKLGGMHEVIPILTKADQVDEDLDWTKHTEAPREDMTRETSHQSSSLVRGEDDSYESIEALRSELRVKLRKEGVRFFSGWLGSEEQLSYDGEGEQSDGGGGSSRRNSSDSLGGLASVVGYMGSTGNNGLGPKKNSPHIGSSQLISPVLPGRAKMPGFHTVNIGEEITHGTMSRIEEMGEEQQSLVGSKLDAKGLYSETNMLDSHGVPVGQTPQFELFRNSQMQDRNKGTTNLAGKVAPYRMVSGGPNEEDHEEDADNGEQKGLPRLEESFFCEPLEKNLVQELRMQLLRCPLVVDCKSPYSDQDIRYGLPRFDGYPPYSPDFLRTILIEGCSLLLIDRTNMLFRNHYERWQRGLRKREQLESAHSYLMSGFMVAAASAMFLLNRGK